MREDENWELLAQGERFADVSSSAKREAKRYRCEVVVVRNGNGRGWQAFGPRPLIKERERQQREEEFARSCERDPGYPSESDPSEMTRPVYGDDWSLVE